MDIQHLFFGFTFVDFVFINFTVLMVVFGALMNSVEPYLPVSFRQSIRYGKFGIKDGKDKVVSLLEVPKSWFKHFYVFAAVYSTLACLLVLYVYLGAGRVPVIVSIFLDLVYGPGRTEKVSSIVSLVAIILINVQCLRRFYETQFIQIFSASSKINLSHYIVGYLHYFGTVTAIVGAAEGFTTSSTDFTVPKTSSLTTRHYLFIGLFLYGWLYQFKSNLILAGLRKNEAGKVVTEKHLMPRGGYFETVSSPHMFFEVVMYVALFGLLYTNITSFYILIWVISNQVHNALMTHKWNKETFKNYPKERKAIFPYIL